MTVERAKAMRAKRETNGAMANEGEERGNG